MKLTFDEPASTATTYTWSYSNAGSNTDIFMTGQNPTGLAQPELTENRTGRKSDTKEIKNKHSSRPVGGAETGAGAERTHEAVAGPRLAECGTNGAGSLTTGRPCSPTFAHR